ncbi:MAG TPA: hypothetical protein DCS93_28050 [Microscillaceae bacterium]|nr:hypothetical protein [Microscillaceae bacterium]
MNENDKWLNINVARIKKLESVKKKQWIGYAFFQTTLINAMKALIQEARKDNKANIYKNNFDQFIDIIEEKDSEYVSKAEINHLSKQIMRPVFDYLYEERGYAFRHGHKHHFTLRGFVIALVLFLIGAIDIFRFPWYWNYSLGLITLAFTLGSLLDVFNKKKI